MSYIINPNVAYLCVVAAVMLAITTILFPRSNWSKIGILVCLAGAGFELFNLRANPWALVVLALSPLPYYAATRQAGPRRSLLLVTGAMFVLGSIYLFVDEKGKPVVNVALLFIVSTICAQFIWVATERRLNAQGIRHGLDRDSVIGLIGTATTQIEDVGLVNIDGEIWSACSDQPIPAGSTVRVVKYMGRVLVVKKVENLTPK